jgi:outer membrane protein assembly factor BamB
VEETAPEKPATEELVAEKPALEEKAIPSADAIWDSHDTMSSQFSTSVPHEGYLYGVDGRQDMPPGRLRCFDPQTGKVQWTRENFPIANLIVADGKLVIVTDHGELVLASASPQAR